MIKNKLVKPLLAFALIIISAIFLTACGGNKQNFPKGSLKDDVYAQAGTHRVTQLDLYEEFRYEGLNVLISLIDEKLLKPQLDKIDYANEDHKAYLVKLINRAVFGTDDEKRLKELDEHPLDKEKQVKTFVDSLVVIGKIKNEDKDALVTELTATSTYDSYSNTLYDIYRNKLASRLFAKEKLDEELKDEKSDAYIKDEKVFEYYERNEKGKYAVDVFYVEFLNMAEQREVFRQLGIKVAGNGKWIKVPNVNIIDSSDPNYVDLTLNEYQHVLEILNDKEIKYHDGSNNRIELTKEDYIKYYDAYLIDTNRTQGPDIPLEKLEILQVMVDAYNLVHDQHVKLEGEKVVYADSSEYPLHKEYDDFETNTTLRNHIYNSLKIPTDENPDYIQYSQRAASLGEYVYLAYKFSEDNALELEILNEKKDGFADNDKAKAKIEEIKGKIADDLLNENYITKQVNEFKKEQKLHIYDPILRTLYENGHKYSGAKKMKDDKLLAKVGDHEITVDEFWTEMEAAFGVSLASDLIANQILREKYYDKITKDQHKTFNEQFKNMILQFSQNGFEMSGYPASLGRDKFILLAFKAQNIDEAIEKTFIVPELKKLFDKDLEAQYENIYEKFAQLSEKQYHNFKQLKASHILIYLDLDLNGKPDKPTELTKEVYDNAVAKLPALIDAINKRIEKEVHLNQGINKLIQDFNDSTRINSDDPYEVEHIWAEFKRFGFRLKNEQLGDITNTSNFVTSGSRLDQKFYDRAMEIYELVKENDKDYFPYLDEEAKANLEKIESAFGWHLIIANGVGEMPSAKLAKDHKSATVKIDDVEYDVSNETDVVNKNQIEAFLKSRDSEYSVKLEMKNALDKQFQPVLAKYQSNHMKSEINYRMLQQAGIVFANEVSTNKFEALRQIAKDQLFDYQLGGTDENFNNLWKDWWTIFA